MTKIIMMTQLREEWLSCREIPLNTVLLSEKFSQALSVLQLRLCVSIVLFIIFIW